MKDTRAGIVENESMFDVYMYQSTSKSTTDLYGQLITLYMVN